MPSTVPAREAPRLEPREVFLDSARIVYSLKIQIYDLQLVEFK